MTNEWTPKQENEWTPKIEKDIPIWDVNKKWAESKYNFLHDMDIGDSVHLVNDTQLAHVLNTLARWRRLNTNGMKNKRFSYRTLKDKSYRLWRVPKLLELGKKRQT
tara:strand:- start:444 stop:761 length:318 start_codon:yes stop_codon:yes gene_type:complete